jgi:hypothetical protein
MEDSRCVDSRAVLSPRTRDLICMLVAVALEAGRYESMLSDNVVSRAETLMATIKFEFMRCGGEGFGAFHG